MEVIQKQIKVITYWTFDLFHKWHLNILKRAKQFWDYLIVWVTWEEYDFSRWKLNVRQSLEERIENIKKTWLADKIIVEYRDWQKISDIKKYNINKFVIWDDWKWKFDYLKELWIDVVYLPRTKWVSSTLLRWDNYWIVKLWVIWTWNIANRFVKGTKFVSWVEIISVLWTTKEKAKEFSKKSEILNYFSKEEIEEFFKTIDAIYIATPHVFHYNYAKLWLENWKHVLCEKPIVLNKYQLEELIELAKKNKLVLLEWIKTLFSPWFIRLQEIVKSWKIWNVQYIESTFTKLLKFDKNKREFREELWWWAFNELGTYVIGWITKLYDAYKIKKVNFRRILEKWVDIFTEVSLDFENKKFWLWKVWLWIKWEWDMLIMWTEWYIYVTSPWWKTEYFEIKWDNWDIIERFYEKFHWDWLRYEISEFVRLIQDKKIESWKYTFEDMLKVASVIDSFNKLN